jgi:hypothetical protein
LQEGHPDEGFYRRVNLAQQGRCTIIARLLEVHKAVERN